MKTQRIVSYVFMIFGAILIITGFTSKAATENGVMSKLTGNTSISTGATLLGIGAILFFIKGQAPSIG